MEAAALVVGRRGTVEQILAGLFGLAGGDYVAGVGNTDGLGEVAQFSKLLKRFGRPR